MTKLAQQAIERMEAARPKSGFMPETEDEWRKLQDAVKFLAYVMYLETGLPIEKANELAEYFHGGVGGRLVLELGYRLQAGSQL